MSCDCAVAEFCRQDEKWAPLVEYILGSSLSSFAVDNTEDKKHLDKIIDDVYKASRAKNLPSKPPICLMEFGGSVSLLTQRETVDYAKYNSKFCELLRFLLFSLQPLNIAKGKAVFPPKSKQYPTVLDVIEFVDEDYVAFNWLIDSASIERVLLFENYQEACGIMRSRNS